ncbi:MAG: HAD family hydrolase [Betaproteobacteria bacterium]|jgi:HAD superfamily hydrolase (TIGR01490 family)
MKLALFDLDNTLLAGDSDFEWAQYLIRQGVLDRELYEARNLEFYEQYRAGTLDIHEFLDFQLKPLARHARRELEGWREDYVRGTVVPMITRKARDLVASHGSDARAVVTATNSFVTRPIAREFGIENLVATDPAENAAGEFTGGVEGVPAFREGKVTRVEQWLSGHGLGWHSFDETWFYSDSLNDLPLLSMVSRPVAVDPDETLKQHALAKGWEIISLR